MCESGRCADGEGVSGWADGRLRSSGGVCVWGGGARVWAPSPSSLEAGGSTATCKAKLLTSSCLLWLAKGRGLTLSCL